MRAAKSYIIAPTSSTAAGAYRRIGDVLQPRMAPDWVCAVCAAPAVPAPPAPRRLRPRLLGCQTSNGLDGEARGQALRCSGVRAARRLCTVTTAAAHLVPADGLVTERDVEDELYPAGRAAPSTRSAPPLSPPSPRSSGGQRDHHGRADCWRRPVAQHSQQSAAHRLTGFGGRREGVGTDSEEHFEARVESLLGELLSAADLDNITDLEPLIADVLFDTQGDRRLRNVQVVPDPRHRRLHAHAHAAPCRTAASSSTWWPRGSRACASVYAAGTNATAGRWTGVLLVRVLCRPWTGSGSSSWRLSSVSEPTAGSHLQPPARRRRGELGNRDGARGGPHGELPGQSATPASCWSTTPVLRASAGADRLP